MPDSRGELEVETLLKLVLGLIAVLLVLRIVEAIISGIAWLLGPFVVVVQLAINDVLATGDPYHWFLLVSHLGMGVQAFVIYRYAEFTIPSVAVATAWFGFNDLVDYFVPIVGDYHHTYFGPRLVNAGDHGVPAHDIAAAAAVGLTILATFLALVIRVHRVENSATREPDRRQSS